MNFFFYFNSVSSWVGVNFKPLLKTLTYVSARRVLDKFMLLGWIIVCLFDWCELHPIRETKNYLRLRHLIVDVHLSLVYHLLLQFDLVVFLLSSFVCGLSSFFAVFLCRVSSYIYNLYIYIYIYIYRLFPRVLNY